jgi:CRP/FNR family transcriptional regulator, anaerobic regulatory protein
MYEQVADYIRKRVSIPAEDLEKAFGNSEVRYFKKGDYVLRMGEYCRFIGFLNSGLIACLFSDESGKEIASGFCFENSFFTYSEGIAHNVPSHKNFLALEDCELLVLEKDKLPSIFAINQKFETLFTQILAEDLRNLLVSAESSRTQSAESRYLKFIEAHPDALNRIPLKYLAGYLGIEAPSLSRLRKKLAGK